MQGKAGICVSVLSLPAQCYKHNVAWRTEAYLFSRCPQPVGCYYRHIVRCVVKARKEAHAIFRICYRSIQPEQSNLPAMSMPRQLQRIAVEVAVAGIVGRVCHHNSESLCRVLCHPFITFDSVAALHTAQEYA